MHRLTPPLKYSHHNTSRHNNAPVHKYTMSNRSITLLQRVDNATEQLNSKFTDIVNSAKVSSKDKSALAMETYLVEESTSAMVRSLEDLLFVTRSLKEAWILGQIRPVVNKAEDGGEGQLADDLLEKIEDSSDGVEDVKKTVT